MLVLSVGVKTCSRFAAHEEGMQMIITIDQKKYLIKWEKWKKLFASVYTIPYKMSTKESLLLVRSCVWLTGQT